MKIASALAFAVALSSLASSASAQNPDYPGYLGVYVQEGNGGMRITSFIRNTPAETLAKQGDIRRGDTIVRLGGRPTRTLTELRAARNRIPDGKEAKMILSSGGAMYHVWISRSEAVAAAAAPGASGSAQPRSAAPDRFYKGGAGEGDEGDFRDARGGAGAPAPDEGEFRDK